MGGLSAAAERAAGSGSGGGGGSTEGLALPSFCCSFACPPFALIPPVSLIAAGAAGAATAARIDATVCISPAVVAVAGRASLPFPPSSFLPSSFPLPSGVGACAGGVRVTPSVAGGAAAPPSTSIFPSSSASFLFSTPFSFPAGSAPAAAVASLASDGGFNGGGDGGPGEASPPPSPPPILASSVSLLADSLAAAAAAASAASAGAVFGCGPCAKEVVGLEEEEEEDQDEDEEEGEEEPNKPE